MRDPKRIKPILKRLERIWEKNPDLRLGQIVANADVTQTKPKRDIFYIEDDELIARIAEQNEV